MFLLFFIVYVHSTLSAVNKEIFMDTRIILALAVKN